VAGFWLELAGSLILTVCGVALATLRPGAAKWSDHGKRRRAQPAGSETQALRRVLSREEPPYHR